MLKFHELSEMADEGVFISFYNENYKQHPLQVKCASGPRYSFDYDHTEFGAYVRVDMPGTTQKTVNVYKDTTSRRHIHIQGYSVKLEWPFDDSRRFYSCTIEILCDDFDRVLLNHEVVNGTCRLFIYRIDNALLSFPTPNNDSGSSEPAVNENHLNPDSVIIEGLQNIVRHDTNCIYCEGEGEDMITSGPLSEKDIHMNRLLYRGMKGVFETKFIGVGKDNYMYFRLDMPDCSNNCYNVEIEEECIVILGLRDSTAECILDEDGGRIYWCRITLKCNCCSFDVGGSCNMHQLQNGVFRLFVKVVNDNNYDNNLVINKEDPSSYCHKKWDDVSDCDAPTSDQCSTTATIKISQTCLRRRCCHATNELSDLM